MCKSIEEMTARLRSLDLKICFDTSFSFIPLKIKLNSETINLKKGQTFLPLIVSSIDQKIDIEFQGYSPHDKQQKIIVDIYDNDTKLDTKILSTFRMNENLYVDNILLKDYNEIFFNGKLTLQFFKKWFECNILNGANLCKDTPLIQWQTLYDDDIKIANLDIFCIGDSFTLGSGVDKQDNWPAILSSKTEADNVNIGSGGLSADGCFLNTKFVLDRFKPKIIICLLPTRLRKIFKFQFLDFHGFVSISIHSNLKMPTIFKDYIEKIKKELLNEQFTKNNWMDSCKNIIEYCHYKNVKCFISTWDESMYQYIPEDVRLPMFPTLNTFVERATDGSHPHAKHYELFVDSILPYIQ
jgi:lysophospholipase L1-like esterase